MKSEPMPPEYSTQVKGYEFSRDKEVDYHGLLQSFRTSGFQATNFGLAVEQITMMVHIMYIMYTQPYCGWLALFMRTESTQYSTCYPVIFYWLFCFLVKLEARGKPVPSAERKIYLEEPGDRPVTNCTIFLGYTSNLISSGVRDTLRFLAKNNMVITSQNIKTNLECH